MSGRSHPKEREIERSNGKGSSNNNSIPNHRALCGRGFLEDIFIASINLTKKNMGVFLWEQQRKFKKR